MKKEQTGTYLSNLISPVAQTTLQSYIWDHYSFFGKPEAITVRPLPDRLTRVWVDVQRTPIAEVAGGEEKPYGSIPAFVLHSQKTGAAATVVKHTKLTVSDPAFPRVGTRSFMHVCVVSIGSLQMVTDGGKTWEFLTKKYGLTSETLQEMLGRLYKEQPVELLGTELAVVLRDPKETDACCQNLANIVERLCIVCQGICPKDGEGITSQI